MTTIEEDVDRPVPRLAAPFKVVATHMGRPALEYEERVITNVGPRVTPILLFEHQGLYNPVTQLLRQYHDLQNQVDALIKERDEALHELAMCRSKDVPAAKAARKARE